MSKIIIVGANHAGTACINTILDNYKGHQVVVFDQNSNISFLGCGMALWIGEQIDNPEGLFYSSAQELESKGATVHMNTRVDWIDYNNKILYATSTQGIKYKEHYDKVVLATGSLPIIPNVPGCELGNIQKVKLYQDALAVVDKIKHDNTIKNVSIIGAGYIGIELVEAFKLKDKNVTLIDIADTCLSTYYDDVFNEKMRLRLKENNVTMKFGQQVVSFDGISRVSHVETVKESIPTDMVIWAVGFRPNNIIGRDDLDLFRNGAYLVDAHQETSIKDVYAIGDCATVKDNSINRTNYIALATNAVRSGIIAAHNICGVPISTQGVQGSNAVSIFGLNMISTGLTQSKAEALGIDVLVSDYSDLLRSEFMNTNHNVDIRIVFERDSRKIIGAQLMSEADVSSMIHTFSLAIQEGLTIDKLKLLDIFFLPHFNKPYNFITMAALNAPNS